MPFNTSIVVALPDVTRYTSPRFKQLIYSHLNYLRETYRNQTVQATPHQGLIWRGDLYGLFHELNISRNLHWTVGAMAGFDDPCDYDGSVLSFVLPTEQDIVILLSRDNAIDAEPR